MEALHLKIAAAAEAILVLIKSRPEAPSKTGIAAIIARALRMPDVSVRKHRMEWERLRAEMTAADAKLRAAAGSFTAAVEAAEDEAGEIQDRLHACAERILREPVRSPADLLLVGEACYWLLFAEPAGLMAPEADTRLAANATRTTAALLRGVRDLGLQASQPWQSRCKSADVQWPLESRG